MTSADIIWLRDDASRALADVAVALDDTEQALLAGFRHPDRQRSFMLSRALLRQALAPRLGVSARSILFARTASGRLVLARESLWRFSLSHGAGLIAIIVAQADCGVDIEVPRPVPFEKIAQRYFSDTENEWLARADAITRARDFFRLWTLKEASVKALQQGLAHNLSRLAFDVSGATPRLMDPAYGLQLVQPFSDEFFLAGAVKTDIEVQWQVREVFLSDL